MCVCARVRVYVSTHLTYVWVLAIMYVVLKSGHTKHGRRRHARLVFRPTTILLHICGKYGHNISENGCMTFILFINLFIFIMYVCVYVF